MVFKRSSLPNLINRTNTEEESALYQSITFDSSKNYPTLSDFVIADSAIKVNDNNNNNNENITSEDPISLDMMNQFTNMADLLKKRFELSLFGFDVIITNNNNSMMIIDVNYFPSYKEVSDFPTRLRHFIRETVNNNNNNNNITNPNK